MGGHARVRFAGPFPCGFLGRAATTRLRSPTQMRFVAEVVGRMTERHLRCAMLFFAALVLVPALISETWSGHRGMYGRSLSNGRT